jgi:hypothetical protein
MAAERLAAPGTEAGPCVGECQHTDCIESHRLAETPCVACSEVIGYDTRFYHRDGAWTLLVHARCVE